MSSLFTKIYKGEIPGFIVDENDKFFCILDRFPIQPGALLVIPKQEVPTVFDLTDADYQELFLFVKKMAAALQKAGKPDRVNLLVEGIEVRDHAHVHVTPVYHSKPLSHDTIHKASDGELREWQEKIQAVL